MHVLSMYCKHLCNQAFSLESSLLRKVAAGDSFASGYANLGGNTSCNFTACTDYGCLPELDSQDATKAWGPVAAATLQADYQLLAWSGVGVVTYDVPESIPESDPEYAALPEWVQEAQYPLDTDLFARQVAGDNASLITNYTTWVPQVSSVPSTPALHVKSGHATCCVTCCVTY